MWKVPHTKSSMPSKRPSLTLTLPVIGILLHWHFSPEGTDPIPPPSRHPAVPAGSSFLNLHRFRAPISGSCWPPQGRASSSSLPFLSCYPALSDRRSLESI